MKAKPYISSETSTIEPHAIVGYNIFCKGCGIEHFIYTHNKFSNCIWEFNGDLEKPTFSPSLLCNPDRQAIRCHSFIKDGNIQYLDDCFHDLKGQIIPLEDIK